MDSQARFWSKVNKNGPIPTHRPDLGPCWLWTRSCVDGYGQFWLDGTNRKAHRVAWEWEHGPVPGTLELDHLCRVRPCVRPSHLDLTTNRENRARGAGTGGVLKITCPQGHTYDSANTYGFRTCRVCQRESDRRRIAADPEKHRRSSREAMRRWRSRNR